jgi:hypothetical protein
MELTAEMDVNCQISVIFGDRRIQADAFWGKGIGLTETNQKLVEAQRAARFREFDRVDENVFVPPIGGRKWLH